MPPYKKTSSMFDRAADTFKGASNTMGNMTRKGATTEYEADPPSAGSLMMQGLGTVGALKQGWQGLNEGYGFLKSAFGAPDPAAQAANAGAGAAQVGQAAQAQQAADAALGSVQLNTGAQVAENGAAGLNMGQAEAMQNLGPMAPELTSGLGDGVGEVGKDAAAQASNSWSWGPIAGSAIGGVAGGMGG